MCNILVVEDNSVISHDFSDAIKNLGYRCTIVKDGSEAIDFLQKNTPDVILTDQKMPNMDGFSVIRIAKEKYPDVPVVMITAHGTVDSAVKAMKIGAFDYLLKPFNTDMIDVVLKKAIEFKKVSEENRTLKLKIQDTFELKNMVFESPIMRQIAKNVIKLAKSDANVLIFGESGTGKELVARSIHTYSYRRNQPFIPVDCVAFPTNLLESELFGFEKGSFTGAYTSKPGVFELAEGGTLFLDEITEMDYHMQPKLLRVLQERKFRRIGSKNFIDANVRVISATNRDPEEAVKEKKLREDLFYRLNVVPIYVPSLRERKEDIPLLVHHFISKYNPFSPVEIHGISNKAMQILKCNDWPGNVRELENVIQRSMSLADKDIIDCDDLPDVIVNKNNEDFDDRLLSLSYKEAKKENFKSFGHQYFSKLLEKYNGNVSKVASAAGISRKTIYRIFDEHDIPRKV